MHPILCDFSMPIRTKRLSLRPVMAGDGRQLNQAVRESIAELKKWMPWAQVVPTIAESEETARRFYADYILRKAFHLGVFQEAHFIGMVGFNAVDWAVRSAAIGYWCRQSAVGQGFITESVKNLAQYAFQEMKLLRLTILCDDENVKSAAVAERVGFILETRAKGLLEKPGSTNLRLSRHYVLFNESVT